MRLTNAKRDSIVESELSKKYHDKKEEFEIKLNELINKEIEKTIPKWITDEMISSGYIITTTSLKFTNRKDVSEKVYSEVRYRSSSSSYPSSRYCCHSIKITKPMEKLVENHFKYEDEKEEFKRKLRRLLYSYTTDKALLKVVPEFQEYFTDEIKSNQLVPVELIADVRKSLAK